MDKILLFFYFFFHVSYGLETKNWQARGEKDKWNLQNKKKIQDLFKNARETEREKTEIQLYGIFKTIQNLLELLVSM